MNNATSRSAAFVSNVKTQCISVSLLLLLGVFSLLTGAPKAHASEPNCAADSRITQHFDNGATWDLCWESRVRENLVLSDVHYTPPGQDAFRVLSSGRLSQLHVAYDDSDVTYNDVTQFGLGGGFLITLTEAECPTGQLLNIQTRPALCSWLKHGDNGFRTPTQAVSADSLNLFSISQVGAYSYITSWTFYDDGTIEPSVGATGALQRSSDNIEEPYGRVLKGDPDTLWLSHTHTYYWRLDFDLGESATDDTVEELKYLVDAQGLRTRDTTVFTTEQARRIDPDAQQFWRIMDSTSPQAVGFQIEPTRNGHRFERKEVEPYTDFDFFVTVGNDCERFASQNARFNPDCLNHVLQYVDDQSVVNEDIVLWNRVSFHHTPRSEDQRHMHAHWDGFKIAPVNLLNGTSTLANQPNTQPEFADLPDRQSPIGELVHADMIRAIDVDGDLLSYSAVGMPPGLELRVDGHVHGFPEQTGTFRVQVTARDDLSKTDAEFVWLIEGSSDSADSQVAENTATDTANDSSTSSGQIAPSLLALLFSFFWIRLSSRGHRAPWTRR